MGRPRWIVLVGATLAVLAVPPAGATLVQADVPADSTAMEARLDGDGDAEWTVTYRVELATDERRAAFADLEDDVATNASAYRDRFRERIAGTVTRAENATGREMAVENLSVATETTGVPAEYGLLHYRFRWTNFTAVDGDRLRAGDALSGLFLDEDTSLTVGWPDGHERASATPEPTATGDRSVTWRGPREFGPGEPRVVVEPAPDGFALWLLGAGLAAAVAAVAGTLAWGRVGTPTGAGDGAGDAGTGEREDATAEDDGPPPELLSNEERVRKLLEEGGRIKQQRIADTLEWTDAKTSQVVGDMREAGEVETFRIGRENVVTLPDHEL